MKTTAEVTAAPAVQARPRAAVLRRADGLELIGEFEGSGFKEPPKLARRADGQVVQLSDLFYAVARAADGSRDVDDVAAVVSEHYGRRVSADNVAYIADRKLRPLGVLALADGSTPEVEKREPLMALRHRRPILSERAVNGGARAFTWLHVPVVKLAVLLAVAAFDVWLFGFHGIAGGLRSAIYNPTLLLAVFASVVVATAFHEFGHASACRYSGARPGVMGVGVYLVWPAFYCDVTDAYRLDRKGRLRTDLGGVYFNAIFALACGGVFFATGEEAALLAAFAQHMIMLQQLLPLLRFDGYYVLTDLTGVPDILSRIKPIFRSIVRGKRREPQVAELKPWVRVVVTAYLVTLIPLLAFFFAWMVISAPRLFATVHDSFGLQVDRIGAAAGPAEGTLAVLRFLLLLMPVAATVLSLTRTVRMTGRGLTRWSRDSAPRKVVATAVAATLLGAVAYVWWPNGDYQPIRPGERGTIGESVASLLDTPGGRPSFTPEREAAYGPIPTVRESEAVRREEGLTGEGDPEGEEGLVRPGEEPGTGTAADPGVTLPGREEDETWWDGSGSAPGGSGYHPPSTGSPAPAPGGSTSSPSTTTTSPPPSGTTSTQPSPGETTAPSEQGTTTTEPAPSDPGTTTETTPPPTTTETAPPALELVPPPSDTTTESVPDTTAPATTVPAPETTTPVP